MEARLTSKTGAPPSQSWCVDCCADMAQLFSMVKGWVTPTFPPDLGIFCHGGGRVFCCSTYDKHILETDFLLI